MSRAARVEALPERNRDPRRRGLRGSRFRLASRGAALLAVGAAALALTAGAWSPVASAATAAAASGVPASGVPASSGQRGQLVSVTPLRTLPDRAAVRAELISDGFDAASARYGVRSYRLVYRTVDAQGRPTTASGLLVLPIRRASRLPVVSFTHGSENYRGDAPSMQPTGLEPAPAYTFASAGFAVADPDYLGPGLQPWMDVPAETTAALDMLRAARVYVTGHGRVLSRDVMISGFSQGASAAVGLARALQDGADRWFRAGALAPISGAYDMQHAELPALLDGELVRLNPSPRMGAKISVIYAAFTLVEFDHVHRIYASPAEVFKKPYARTIEQLFDGNDTGQQMFNGTPGELSQLLTARGFALLRHPTGAFLAELKADDSNCADWTPIAPTRLYMAANDEQAVNANTFHCQAEFAASGRRIPIVNLGTPDYQNSRHLGSNMAGTAQIVRWFSRLARLSGAAA